MTDRPIIFSGPMVRALIEGRKTQTRRLLKDQTALNGKEAIVRRWPRQQGVTPYQPGDRLWVRETFLFWSGGHDCEITFADEKYRQTGPNTGEIPDAALVSYFRMVDRSAGKAIGYPSIHMPRWASRLTLTVTDVRVQRLQEISRDDVIAEGITERDGAPIGDVWAGWHEPYAALWDSLHGNGSWDANPWIVAVTFTVANGNIDSSPLAP